MILGFWLFTLLLPLISFSNSSLTALGSCRARCLIGISESGGPTLRSSHFSSKSVPPSWWYHLSQQEGRGQGVFLASPFLPSSPVFFHWECYWKGSSPGPLCLQMVEGRRHQEHELRCSACPWAFSKFIQSHARTFCRNSEYPHTSPQSLRLWGYGLCLPIFPYLAFLFLELSRSSYTTDSDSQKSQVCAHHRTFSQAVISLEIPSHYPLCIWLTPTPFLCWVLPI